MSETVGKVHGHLRLLSGKFPTLGRATLKVYAFCSPGLVMGRFSNKKNKQK